MKPLRLLAISGIAFVLLSTPRVTFAQESSDKSNAEEHLHAGTTSIVIIEHAGPTRSTMIDLGAKGKSQGDMLVYNDVLTDENGTESGMSSGFCVLTQVENTISECVWTYHLADGTITVSGTDTDSAPNVETHIPVVGGTGAYAGARGVVHEVHNEDQTIYTATVEIANNSLLSATGAMTETTTMTDTASMTETTTMTAPTRADDVVAYWNSVMHWADIATVDQEAWRVLGWNEKNWESDDPTTIPVTETTAWEDLTSAEQAAATSLGYDEATWLSLQARKPEGDVEKFWSTQQWSDLKYSERRLFGILGWDAKKWASSTDLPASETTTWAKLTTKQRDAATQLGYDQKAWDMPTAK